MMNLTCTTTVKVLAKNPPHSFTANNGNSLNWYDILCLAQDPYTGSFDSGTLTCSQEVYDKVVPEGEYEIAVAMTIDARTNKLKQKCVAVLTDFSNLK